MRNFCCGLILSLATGILFSCESKTQEKRFFDVPAYFEKEVERIPATYSKVIKTTYYNGESSITQLGMEDINWKKELGIFIECDLNKPIYYSYLLSIKDTAFHSNTIKYISRSDKTNVREVIIQYLDASGLEKAEYISFEIRKSNLLNASNIHAVYARDNYYLVEGTQEIKHLSITNHFSIMTKFKK